MGALAEYEFRRLHPSGCDTGNLAQAEADGEQLTSAEAGPIFILLSAAGDE